MKYAVILCDGMADWPVESLGGKTPLEAARHPNMDALAQDGTFGLVQTIPEGMTPGSDTANLAVFGYNPRVYYSGRSPLEAANLGVPLTLSDVTYRCNFVTLSSEKRLCDAVMLDYSAGEISSEEAVELVTALNEALANQSVRLYPGFSYRHCLVIKDGQTGAELTPPHDIPNKSVQGRLPEGENAALLTKWMETAYDMLSAHPVNRARVAAGKNPANAIWFWGEGRKPALTPFYEKTGLHGAVVSAVDLIRGIGKCAEMEVMLVEGATGTYTTNFSGKATACIDAFSRGLDYVYVHIEAPDECGHHGQLREKIYSIEQIDEKIIGPVWNYLEQCGEPYVLVVLPDHPTPVAYRTHVAEPVPFALYRKGDAAHGKRRYTEKEAALTGVQISEGFRLVDWMRSVVK